MKIDEEKAFESYLNSSEINYCFTQVVNPIPVGLIPTANKKSLEEAFQTLAFEGNKMTPIEKTPTIPIENLPMLPKKGIASLLNRFGIRAKAKKSEGLEEKKRFTPGSGKSSAG